jgi:hypothetical protein
MSFIASAGAVLQGLFGLLQKVSPSQQTPSTSTDPSITIPFAPNAAQQGGMKALFNQIQSAVTSALQSASTSGASGSTNVNQIIQKAIENVLNNAADGAPVDSSSASTTPASTDEAFDQLLQAHGINAQQFRDDFQAALQNVQNGGVKLSQIFQNFPTGSAVDVTV